MPPDYSGQNLRGRSFKGQNLAGADFSHADIRSTNFTGANLCGANFTGAKAGLQKRWALLLVLLSWVLLGVSGFLFLLSMALISQIFDSSQSPEYQFAGWVALIVTFHPSDKRRISKRVSPNKKTLISNKKTVLPG